MEEVLVVAVERSAIGEDETRLPLPPSAPASLGVVCRGRRDVAKMHQIQVRDVHAQFHRGRADHVWQTAPDFTLLACVGVFPPEPTFSTLTFSCGDHLRRMFARLKPAQHARGLSVEPLEERIHLWWRGRVSPSRRAARIDRIGW